MSYAFTVIEKTFYNGAVANTVAPTFSGISSVTANSDGSFTLGWSAATGSAAAPIRYRMYAALGSVSAAALFVNSNWVTTTKSGVTGGNVFQLGDQVTFFMNGQTYTFGVRAVSSENVAETNTAILTATSTGVSYSNILSMVPPAVWDVLAASHTTSGTFGKNLDAQVSTRLPTSGYTAPDNADIVAIKAKTDQMLFDGSSFIKANAEVTIDDANILAIKAKTDNLPSDPASNTVVNTRAPASTAVSNADLTTGRITKLDNLDVAVSTRLAAAAYTAPDNSDIAAIKAKTDNLPASPASTGDVTSAEATLAADIALIPTNPLLATDSRLNHLDADISTRLPTSGYTAPDNADIAAIKAKTDNLPSDPASQTTSDGIKKNTDLIPATL
jgi:hypothetical protein